MTHTKDSISIIPAIGKALILLCLVFVVILSGKFTDLMSGTGFAVVFLGGIALTLISFSLEEIGSAFKQTAGRENAAEDLKKAGYFWEAVVRNFWMMGILGSVVSFVIALGNSEGGIFGIASRMSASYLSAVYGMALALICAVPALKTSGILDAQSNKETEKNLEENADGHIPLLRYETAIGYILFVVVLSWAILAPLMARALEGPLKPQNLFLYWPSLLMVLGGTTAIALFVGNGAAGKSLTIGFALTGFLATLMGCVQAMFAFSYKNIQDVASAITFILSSCFIALLGMMLVGNPLADRSVKAGPMQKMQTLNRIAWFVFPLMALILLALTFVMVVTPIQKG